VIICPSVVAILLRNDAYAYVYSLSAIFLIPLYICVKKLKYKAPLSVPNVQIKDALLAYISNKNLRNIFASQFLLQLFYAFMGIYMPLYLQKYIGFEWSEIGIIFTIMLLPFIIFELPVGNMADKKYGEKEFLSIGQIIMGLATLCIAFITIKSFVLWVVVLFITRIGASFVEITAESFFFKHVNQNDGEVISFFRITRPLSFILAPVLATIALQFIPFQYMFIMLGSIMIVGVRYSFGITDTR
jgi:MFS family permease